jgi:apolipoprotein D and lipocalin family protein
VRVEILRALKWLPLLFAALVAVSCAGRHAADDPDFDFEDDPPLHPVVYVDLDRYMGRWYIIANIPYFVEAGNVAVYVDYSRRPDGLIADRYTGRDAFDEAPFTKDGLIEVLNPVNNAEGRITFLPPIWQDYAVLHLDADYRYTVIGHPSRDYAWIFAREPLMSDAAYASALQSLRANGFDVSRVLKIPQRVEDVGQPGYQ